MDINPTMLKPIAPTAVGSTQSESPSSKALGTFSDMLSDSIRQVDNLQKSADAAVERFVAGDIDIHDVMIETEKANVALQLTIQLRNKVLEAYQEVTRMQI